jgi:hypothetical protein
MPVTAMPAGPFALSFAFLATDATATVAAGIRRLPSEGSGR